MGKSVVVGGLVFLFALAASQPLGSWFFQTFNLAGLLPSASYQAPVTFLVGFIGAVVVGTVAANLLLWLARRVRPAKAQREEQTTNPPASKTSPSTIAGLTMKCPNCGQETGPDSRFCGSCGAKLG